ncbi:hypothetical protein CC80DRAFT_493868 [Byssothecium circinans]|uniref:Secreted protein n=1 Tax=Byssothecium circinans TaxID=147558 RepID=A0A6A5TQY7_9PLEO|nr:hypothetical protein CC80DRAFT_493868 [Byssothecium circinans]
MRSFLSILPAITLTHFISSATAGGFHLMDRSLTWRYTECVDCPRKQQCCGTYTGNHEDLILVPANQFSCDTVHSNAWKTGLWDSSQIGHGTVIQGKCGSRSLTLYPTNNGAELEVWESDGSRKYGNCYRQEPNRSMDCTEGGDATCRNMDGEPMGTCKIKATSVWVCPVDLC